MTVQFVPASPGSFAVRSDCLLSFDAADGYAKARSGQALTFARATPGTFIDSAGRIALASNHQPRITYDGAAFDTPGYLAEPASTNLLLRSSDPSHAYWARTNVGSVVLSTTQKAPDGSFAYKMFENTTNGPHALTSTGITVAAGAYGTMSVCVKASERSRIYLGFFNAGNQVYGKFRTDLLTVSTTVAGTGTTQDTGIQALGDGWYRCWITGRAGAAITALTCEVWIVDAADATSYAGATTNGLYLWGMDFQAGTTDGAFVLSHIPTTTATVTRNVDALTFTPAWYFHNDLTLYGEVSRPLWASHSGYANAVGGGLFSISNAGATPILEIGIMTSSSLKTAFGQLNDTITGLLASSAWATGSDIEVCANITNILSAPKVRIDVGSGFGSYTATGIRVASWGGSQVAAIGNKSYAGAYATGAAVQRVRLAQGLWTLDQMRGRR